MWTGKQTLQELNRAIASIRGDIDRYDQAMNLTTQALARNQLQQTRLIHSIANIRLQELERGTLDEDLDQVDREVIRLLEKRDTSRVALKGKLQAVAGELAALEQEREVLARTVDVKAEAVIGAEHGVQEKLEFDAQYQQLLDEARKADSVADEALTKADVAQRDRIEKGLPYENDKLFIYLWQRGFGTAPYKANPLTRALDGWVAGVCNYEANRANYWTLLEIPRRLQQHAQAARDLAQREINKIEEYEIAAARQGGVPGVQDELQQAEEILKKHDARIEVAEHKEQKLMEEGANLSSAENPFSKAGLAKLSDIFRRLDILTLDEKVKTTPTREDDELLRELRELQAEAANRHDDLKESRRHRDKQIERILELEDVRRQFKKRSYDDVRSGFGKEEIIVNMLGQFLGGVISGADLWGTMKRQQRHRDVGAWPDFGSGGLGRRQSERGSVRKGQRKVWHDPGRGDGEGFRLPKKGGFSSRGRGDGGGFKTGGGF